MDKPTFSPEETLRLMHQGFFTHLATLGLPERAEAPPLRERILARVGELERKTAHLVAHPLDTSNVGFTVLAVAAYEVLLAGNLSAPEARRIVEECLNAPLRSWVLEGTREMLDSAEDPFAALVAASKEREAHYFGPSFHFERPVDDGFGYVLHVKRCLFHETLKACGRTELQPLLCRVDLNWIDAIDPRRHHLAFARPSTFASAGLCRMWFMRLEHLEEDSTPQPLPVDHAATHR